MTQTSEDATGLHLDMLDVDRLREFARQLLIHGGDVTNWASEMQLASKLQAIATCIEKTVRDVGVLRLERERLQAFLEREHYRRCDIAACNCGSYHKVEAER